MRTGQCALRTENKQRAHSGVKWKKKSRCQKSILLMDPHSGLYLSLSISLRLIAAAALHEIPSISLFSIRVHFKINKTKKETTNSSGNTLNNNNQRENWSSVGKNKVTAHAQRNAKHSAHTLFWPTHDVITIRSLHFQRERNMCVQQSRYREKWDNRIKYNKKKKTSMAAQPRVGRQQ